MDPVNPITFEIVRHRLFRVVEEAVISSNTSPAAPSPMKATI